MTIEEMIMQEIERVPRTKQTDLQKNYIDLYKEKEQYRYEVVAKEQLIEKWKKAYAKLYKSYEKLLEEKECNTK